MKIVFAVACIAFLMAVTERASAASMWDVVGELSKSFERQRFCQSNPRDESCEQDEKKRKFCELNRDHESCGGVSASVLLFLCEGNDAYNMGVCHARLSAYAESGINEVIEWQCAPKDAIGNAEQLRRLFIREANHSPEALHFSARKFLYYTVTKAFPCKLNKQ